MSRTITLIIATSFMLTGCLPWPIPEPDDTTPMVNLQVTEKENRTAFDRVMTELENRGYTATLIVSDEFATENCQRLQELDDAGYEIMAYIRPDDPEQLPTELSYEDQYNLIAEIKSAIEDCLAHDIDGLRAYRFAQNEDSYQIIQELGIEYNLGFVAGTSSSLAGHENDVLPYRSDQYDFWAVPMHSVSTNDGPRAFCDMPFKSYSDDAWEALLKTEFNHMNAQGRPLLVEIHPYFIGADDGRFEAFVNFLDHVEENNARFITAAELVHWSQDSSN
jgi:hypothetical protein